MSIDLSDATIAKIVKGLITEGETAAQNESEKKLRNTKELLRNYKFLENHMDVDLPKLDESTPLSKRELSLFALLGYRARSKEMMLFINRIIERYEVICNAGTPEDQRRYAVIKRLYLSEPSMTRERLAELYHVDERSIRRDESKAIDELTVMLFGIDGVNDMSK